MTTAKEERHHMSNARAFDTLVTANLQLIRLMRVFVPVVIFSMLVGTGMSAYSAFLIRDGQSTTHELIAALGRSRCGDVSGR